MRIWIFILLLPLLSTGQQHSESILKRTITINRENQPVAIILNELSQKANLFFSYDASVIVSDRTVSLNVKNVPVLEVLHSLFDKNLFLFIEKADHVIILLKENNNEATNIDTCSKKPSFIELTGRIVDKKTNLPIQYANISLWGEPVGTITNTDGEFILKIPAEYDKNDIGISCVGYSSKILSVTELKQHQTIFLAPVIILIKQVNINPVSPEYILDQALKNIQDNYFTKHMMDKAFYRETIQENDTYVNVSEAVLNILKSPYSNYQREDNVQVLKGRKSPEVSPFKWIDFKLQGGPKSITQLDIIKTNDTFLDPRFRNSYEYKIDRVIWYFSRPVYVLSFRPVAKVSFLCYHGEMYVDRETFAICHINFHLDKYGLKLASRQLIKKKSRGLKVKALVADYKVDYKQHEGKWYFSAARANVSFKIKDRSEKINSVFESTSELLITETEQSQIKRLPRKKAFSITEIFTDKINDYDEKFWGNYNTIKPNESLVNALKNIKQVLNTK